MRIFRDKRGQARLIEAFLATLLLVGCIAILPSYFKTNQPHDLTSVGQEMIASLNNNGQLARLIDAQNWPALKSCVEAAIPLTLWYNLTVFDETMNPLNPLLLCSSGAVSDNIGSTDYIIASPNSTFTLYVLRIQLSQVGS
jgi:hypothetical protein